MTGLKSWWRHWRWRRSERKRMEALITRWAERPAVVGGKTAGPLPYETWDEFVARM